MSDTELSPPLPTTFLFGLTFGGLLWRTFMHSVDWIFRRLGANYSPTTKRVGCANFFLRHKDGPHFPDPVAYLNIENHKRAKVQSKFLEMCSYFIYLLFIVPMLSQILQNWGTTQLWINRSWIVYTRDTAWMIITANSTELIAASSLLEASRDVWLHHGGIIFLGTFAIAAGSHSSIPTADRNLFMSWATLFAGINALMAGVFSLIMIKYHLSPTRLHFKSFLSKLLFAEYVLKVVLLTVVPSVFSALHWSFLEESSPVKILWVVGPLVFMPAQFVTLFTLDKIRKMNHARELALFKEPLFRKRKSKKPEAFIENLP